MPLCLLAKSHNRDVDLPQRPWLPPHIEQYIQRRDLNLFASELGWLLYHLLDILFTEKLVVLDIRQSPVLLPLDDPRHHLLQYLSLECLSPVATLLSHATICLYPLVEPLAHHFFYTLPILVLFHLTEPVLQFQHISLQFFNLFLIILLDLSYLFMICIVGSTLFGHPLNNRSIHRVVGLTNATETLLGSYQGFSSG